ncbi:MAG: hypothetical protein FJ276_31835 [Planctomycetes bacterium]|nr:hypothetical protein [Planctomycetota bacterium]
MAAILERARCAIPPCADEYEDRKLRLLVAVCRELQRNAGEHPFFLAARTGARLLGLDRNHVKVWRWLFLLQQDKVILEIEKGDHAKRRASRYRYLRE